MKLINSDIETNINLFARELVKFSLELKDSALIKKAKTELSDSSAFLVASYHSAMQQTTPLNVTVRLNQAIDYAGKCKFWIDFLIDEGFLQEPFKSKINASLNEVFEQLNLERTRKENEIPVFASDWLLDF